MAMTLTERTKRLGISLRSWYRYSEKPNFPLRGTVDQQKAWLENNKAPCGRPSKAAVQARAAESPHVSGLDWGGRNKRADALRKEQQLIEYKRQVFELFREELRDECMHWMKAFRSGLHRLKLSEEQQGELNGLIQDCSDSLGSRHGSE